MSASLLASLESKLRFIRTLVNGVVEGYHSALYLWGEGGTSKSYTVEEALKASGHPYRITNSRLTAKGLFELLRDFPDVTHVLEDMETLFRDKNAAGVLRSATWGQSKDGVMERPVSWVTGGNRQEFLFTGRIIIVANMPLANLPELRALGTRINPILYDATNEEIAALMLKIAEAGHRHGSMYLEPSECREVAEAIIERSSRIQRSLDLRILVNMFQDRLQWSNGESEIHWRSLLDGRMKQKVFGEDVGVWEAMKEHEYTVLRETRHLLPAQRLAAWKEKTNKSKAAMYRRLAELGSQSSVESEKVRPETENELPATLIAPEPQAAVARVISHTFRETEVWQNGRRINCR